MRAGLAQQSKRQGDPVAFAFATLDDVAQPQRTQWSIVYDTARRMVHWRTPANKEVRSAGFVGLDLPCAAPTTQLSIHEGRGEVTHHFRSYRSADNERLL